jgi:hypothetical protein
MKIEDGVRRGDSASTVRCALLDVLVLLGFVFGRDGGSARSSGARPRCSGVVKKFREEVSKICKDRIPKEGGGSSRWRWNR